MKRWFAARLVLLVLGLVVVHPAIAPLEQGTVQDVFREKYGPSFGAGTGENPFSGGFTR